MKRNYDTSWDLKESGEGNLPQDKDTFDKIYTLSGRNGHGSHGYVATLSSPFLSSEWRMTMMPISRT
ncbi:MAG: hypothetical protein ABII90_02545 [Bacteroidota bacterium]